MAMVSGIRQAVGKKCPSRTELAGTFSWPDGGSVADGLPSGRQCQGITELGFSGPTLWQMQSEPSGQGEEAPEGLGGHYLLAQIEPRRPASEVMRHHLDRQPGGETARLRDRRSLGILENPRVGGFT